MPIYVYECPCGQWETLQSHTEPAIGKCANGHPARRIISQVGLISTTNPEQESRKEARYYRTNKEVVNGLVNGTMNPPEDRDVAGDKMPRSAVAQLNGMLDHARKMK